MAAQTSQMLWCSAADEAERPVAGKIPDVDDGACKGSAGIRPTASWNESHYSLENHWQPDAIDPGRDGTDHFRVNLLGFCANDHNENLAYIYFTERWTDDIARRDPLRDRYVIVFFSAEGKLTHMFSNVADIPPIFPHRKSLWERLMWGPPTKN
jgi:hypothetical protein